MDRRLAIVALGYALLLAGCGGSGHGTADDSAFETTNVDNTPTFSNGDPDNEWGYWNDSARAKDSSARSLRHR